MWATPTKPGRSAAGLDVVREVADSHPSRPWFVIGGVDAENTRETLAAGASRIAVVRAITRARDPEAAARELVSQLGG